ncbi:MAG: hypothetical protein ACOY4Q_12570 [Bacillota bacterium]
MAHVNFVEGFKAVAVDQPFFSPLALINLIPGEQVLASVTINVDNKDINAVWLTGEIGWRITPIAPVDARGRIRIRIVRNSVEIYRREEDTFIPPGFPCARSTAIITGLDDNPGTGPVTYALAASLASAEYLNNFMVVGPVNLFAGGMKKLLAADETSC